MSFEKSLKQVFLLIKSPAHQLFFVCILMLGIFFRATVVDPDLFARLAVGKLILDNQYVSTVDPFAFTPIKELWIDHEWLAGLCFYLIAMLGGASGLFLTKCVFAFLTIFFIYKAALVNRSQKESSIFYIFFAAVACCYLWTSTIRSQVFSFLILSFLFYAIRLHRHRRSSLLILIFPFVQVLGVNAHAGGLLASVFFGLYFITDYLKSFKFSKALVITAVLLSFTFFLTPYGIDFWLYLISALGMKRPGISEWSTLSLADFHAWLFLFWCLAIVFGLYKSKQKPDLFFCLGLVFSIFVGIKSQRFTAVVYLFGVCFADEYLEETSKFLLSVCSSRFRSLLLECLAIVVVLVFPLWSIYGLKSFQPMSLDPYPVKALDWLYKNRPAGNLLVGFNEGSYALWYLYPKIKVSVDGRYEELYSQAIVSKVAKALNWTHKDQEAYIAEINPDYILSYCSEINEAKLSEWHLGYRDPLFCLLERQQGHVYVAASANEASYANYWIYNPHNEA